MILFQCDYNEGAHPKILEALAKTNMEQTPGYGEDVYCSRAAGIIREKCGLTDLDVHFLCGGTQANMTVIDAGLRSHQGVVSAATGHIHVHETGAVESLGHKVLAVEGQDGKLTAEQVRRLYREHVENDSYEHMVQPKMVYISNPTELGTIYSKQELTDLCNVCRECGLYLFMDGARLGYGLMAQDNELDLPMIARCCDAFYIGGTKMGALFGEAVVLKHPDLKKDFRYFIKQKGGMLAKGRLLGIQFITLLEEDLYFKLGAHADCLAEKLRTAFARKGYSFLVENRTNQIFPILPDEHLTVLQRKYGFSYQQRMDDGYCAVRFCTSWATREENVKSLVEDIYGL